MMHWKEEFFIIITSKGFVNQNSVDSEERETDSTIISESEVPHWFELDTLYMYKFDTPTDESEVFKKFNGKSILMAEPAQDPKFKGKYNFVFELKEKVYFVGVETCKELNRWVAALRKAKSICDDESRLKHIGKPRNIDPFVTLYKRRRPDDIAVMAKNDIRREYQNKLNVGEDLSKNIEGLAEAQKSLLGVG